MFKDDVLLVAGNLTSVSSCVSETCKKDVVDSVLFSQLYASSKISKFSDSQLWYKNFTEAMTKIKWKTGGYKFSDVMFDEGVSIILNILIQKRLGSLVGLPQTEQFERLMSSIQQGYATEAIALLIEEHAMVSQVEEKASTVSTVVLHINLAAMGPKICSIFVCFKTTQQIKSNLFCQEFNSELIVGEIGIGVTQFVLDKDAFEKTRMREKILRSLPDVTAPLVLDIIAKSDDQVR